MRIADPVQFNVNGHWVAAIATHVGEDGKLDLYVVGCDRHGIRPSQQKNVAEGTTSGTWRTPA